MRAAQIDRPNGPFEIVDNNPFSVVHAAITIPICYERKTDYFSRNSYLWICRNCGSRDSFFGRKEAEQSRFGAARSVFDFEVQRDI
jgi:hypothetical protein